MKSKRQGGQFPDEPMTFPGGQLVTGPQGLLLKSARWKEIFLDEKGFVKRQASGKQRAIQAGPWMGPGDLDPTPRLLLGTWTRLSYQSPHLKTERTAFRFPSNIFNGFLSLSFFFFLANSSLILSFQVSANDVNVQIPAVLFTRLHLSAHPTCIHSLNHVLSNVETFIAFRCSLAFLTNGQWAFPEAAGPGSPSWLKYRGREKIRSPSGKPARREIGESVKLCCFAHCALLSFRNYWLFKIVVDL